MIDLEALGLQLRRDPAIAGPAVFGGQIYQPQFVVDYQGRAPLFGIGLPLSTRRILVRTHRR